MADQPVESLSITSLRGGMNDTDPAPSLPADQCPNATNVELFQSMLGERRGGCSPLSIAGSLFANENRMVHLSEWYPTGSPSAPEWWGVAATIGSSTTWGHRPNDGNWQTVVPVDAVIANAPGVYQISNQPLYSQIALNFFAYPSAVDRLHVWDGATLRRTGLAQPQGAPTWANTGSGSFTGTRYYRVRFANISPTTGKTIVLSEPSAVATATPSGSGAGILITRPTRIMESETHWVLEASEGNANFYILATTVVGTLTYTDNTSFTTGYTGGILSANIGEYVLQPSAKYLSVDGDRLVMGGHQTDASKASTIWWTPVSNDPGVGNAERLPASVNNSQVLDNGDGGSITGVAAGVFGTWYAFKWSRVYGMVRTGDSTTAYSVITISTTHGAIPGSVFSGVDEGGNPCVYFLDPLYGPSRVGPFGIQTLYGLRTTWSRVNLHATLPALGTFYPYKRQAWWLVAVDGNDTPNLGLKLQTSELRNRPGSSDVWRGWSLFTGLITNAYCIGALSQTTTANNVDSLNLRPCVGLSTPNYIQRCDLGSDDAGVAYTATITTRPFFSSGGLLQWWGAMAGALLATATNANSLITLTFIGDFGLIDSISVTTDMVASGAGESYVIRLLEDLNISSVRTLQIQFTG